MIAAYIHRVSGLVLGGDGLSTSWISVVTSESEDIMIFVDKSKAEALKPHVQAIDDILRAEKANATDDFDNGNITE